MVSSAVTGILSYKAAKSIFEFLKEELFMGKVIIVRLKKHLAMYIEPLDWNSKKCVTEILQVI